MSRTDEVQASARAEAEAVAQRKAVLSKAASALAVLSVHVAAIPVVFDGEDPLVPALDALAQVGTDLSALVPE